MWEVRWAGKTADSIRDCVNWGEDHFHQAIDAMSGILGEQGKPISEVPISALHGDNLLEPSPDTPWIARDSTSPTTLIDAIDRAVMA